MRRSKTSEACTHICFTSVHMYTNMRIRAHSGTCQLPRRHIDGVTALHSHPADLTNCCLRPREASHTAMGSRKGTRTQGSKETTCTPQRFTKTRNYCRALKIKLSNAKKEKLALNGDLLLPCLKIWQYSDKSLLYSPLSPHYAAPPSSNPHRLVKAQLS